MAGDVVLARLYTAEIETAVADTYVEIDGLESIEAGVETERADGGHYGTGGWKKHSVTERGLSYTLSGKTLMDRDTGVRDPGQERLIVLGRAIGDDAMANFRLTSPRGHVRTGLVSVEFTPGGGDRNSNATWQAVLTFDGEPTDDDTGVA